MIKFIVLISCSFLMATASFANDSTIVDENSSVDLNTNNTKLDNSIDVGTPGVKKVRVAIPNFSLSDNNLPITSNDALKFTKRFHDILDFTNWFEFVPQNAFISKKNPVLEPFQAQDWAIIKTEFVIFGKITRAKNAKNFNLELRLYNVKLQNMLVGKMYANLNLNLADIALRRFGDVLVESLTGTPGPFMSKIAFVGKRNAKNSQIYTADFDGNNAVPITKNNSVNISPAWSPDGTKLTYTSFVTGAPEIYQYNTLTKRTVQMTSGASNSSGSNWSSDGDTIAYSSSTKNGETHIFTMNAFGGNKRALINSSEIEVEPSYSPNGKYLAFTSNRFGKPMIFTRDLKTGEDSRLTYAGWYNASASWSPDSTTLAFASYDRKIDRWDLFKINSDGSRLERLTLSQGDNEKPTWSPDGRFIMFQSTRSSSGNNTINSISKLYVMSKDGYFSKDLPTAVSEIRQPVWGPRLEQIPIDKD
ncbi:MAG: DPP IV N-terminal domain-containing protein [Bdellovibrionota bacterium]